MSRTPFPMAERPLKVEVDGGRITGWLSGTGPPLLLLHGGPGLSDYLSGLAAELAPTFTVFRYQQRGVPPSVTDGDRTVEGHVADAARVLDRLGWKRAIIAGHSWGGHLAMHVAVAHAERTRALVVLDALGAVPDGGEQALGTNLMRPLPDAQRARIEEIIAREERGETNEAEQLESLSILWPYYFADPSLAPPMPPMRFDVEGGLATWASIRAHFTARTLEDGLPGLTMPTLIVHGELDPVPPVEAERTAAIIPGAELRILPGIGHFPWDEQPGIAREILEEFAARLPD